MVVCTFRASASVQRQCEHPACTAQAMHIHGRVLTCHFRYASMFEAPCDKSVSRNSLCSDRVTSPDEFEPYSSNCRLFMCDVFLTVPRLSFSCPLMSLICFTAAPSFPQLPLNCASLSSWPFATIRVCPMRQLLLINPVPANSENPQPFRVSS